MKESKVDHRNKRAEKKITTPTTIELVKHRCKKGLHGVVGKTTMKRISLYWAYEKHLTNLR